MQSKVLIRQEFMSESERDQQVELLTYFLFGAKTSIEESLKLTPTEPSVIAYPMPYLLQ
jgi:hypothetical protein